LFERRRKDENAGNQAEGKRAGVKEYLWNL